MASAARTFSGQSRLRQPPRAQREGDVLADVHVREQRVILEHDADVALVRRHEGDVAVAEMDRAGRGLDEAAEDAEQRGLSGPRRPEQRDELTRRDLERDVIERADRVVILARGPDVDAFSALVQ